MSYIMTLHDFDVSSDHWQPDEVIPRQSLSHENSTNTPSHASTLQKSEHFALGRKYLISIL